MLIEKLLEWEKVISLQCYSPKALVAIFHHFVNFH